MRGNGAGREAAVDGHLVRSDAEPLEFGAVAGSRSDSLGEPIAEGAGRISPRAPRRVFSVSSVSWKT